MVAEIQLLSYLYHEEVEPVHFTPDDKYSTDDQIALIAFLLNLEEYYNLYQTLTINEIYNRIDGDIETLKEKMLDISHENITNGYMDSIKEVLDKYGIRHDWLDTVDDFVDDKLVDTGIVASLNQLRDDIKSKCLYYLTFALGDIFNISPNFKRAIKRISDVIVNNIRLSLEKGTRSVLSFVYGDDMLYRWVCRNDARTCAVCRAKAREAPKKIDEWDYDHPYGRCTLEPVSNKYSDEFKRYLEII